ncbi:MAG: TerB family tellurite resistance protein [Gemmatimonadetes bacterium]|nr:TerB family tellurite resistance protein [Gemmatimonadota bacterium]MBP6669824.1 TerB family tellurite resistance protein [Gemmatimonadales bacterium]MBK7348477.1 TerB family tellurite resistance protein [Gemmatimonadota bacterium]MBK7714045.1 TerB family tellurite resistance protein [Gemmatimonadota bacterium]MBK7783102.1 TerB family tellurite resistance protein [Gemmatimonadota bacterium]
MLDAIRNLVTRKVLPPATGPRGGESVQLAACALLLELAHADGEFSAPERAHIEGSLARHFGLDAAGAAELLTLAEAARSASVDHFQFTRVIAAQYDLGQKMVLAEVMWGVILADGQLAEHEAYLVRKIANLLELEPGYLAQARRAAAPPT